MRDTRSEEWPSRRLRFLTSRNTPLQMAASSEVTFLPMEAIGEQGEIDLSIARPIEDVQSGYSRFNDGDVVVAKITPCFENGKGALIRNTLTGVGFGTTELHVLTPGPEIDGRFLYYVTVDPRFRGLGQACMTGAAGQQRVPEDFVRDHRIPVLPVSQQRAIADYLDRETARLDALVAAKERLLGLLAEKRRALITRAVTRGLAPHAPLRDSGIPWLGEIPAHWDAVRLKVLLKGVEQGWSPQCETVTAQAGEWGVLRVGAVNGAEFNPQENKRLPDDVEPLVEYEIRPGDVLMSRANTTELLGSAALVRNVQPKLLLCDKLYRLIVRREAILPEFLVLFLRSAAGRFPLERDATGASSSMQNIGQDSVRDSLVPLPPLFEQSAIVAQIQTNTAKLDALRLATERTIALLKERRAALISAAVTGKIPVDARSDCAHGEEAQ